MSPAFAWALRILILRPPRSTASASCRPFRVCRGRRNRKPPFYVAPPTAGTVRSEPLLVVQSRRPVAARSNWCDPPPARSEPPRRPATPHAPSPARVQRRHASPEIGSRPWRTRFARTGRCPPEHRTLGRSGAGPAFQRQEYRPRPIRLSTVTGTRQAAQLLALLLRRCHWRLARHDPPLRINPESESQPPSVGDPQQACLGVLLLQLRAEAGFGFIDEGPATLGIDEDVGLAGVERDPLGPHVEE